MSHDLPLPAQRHSVPVLLQRGERVGVRGRGTHRASASVLPLTLTLSPQAGRGNPVAHAGGGGLRSQQVQ